MSSILVFIEQNDGIVNSSSTEAIGVARSLSERSESEVLVVSLGKEAENAANQAIKLGADKAFFCDHESLVDYRAEPYAAILANVVNDEKPMAVLASSTASGRDVLALAAVDCDCGLAPDCTAMEIEDGVIKATRPVYAGKLMTIISTVGDTGFFGLRGRAFPAPEEDDGSTGEVVALEPAMSESDIGVQVLGVEATAGEVSLNDASIIVSGGRGVGGEEGFEPVRDLAGTLGAAMGASRAAVDAGWIPYANQVGQT
ncbi:MAG: electron transfer flavoprotein subunit alpha/FixB family protein, partial [Chloroflexota bacterium]